MVGLRKKVLVLDYDERVLIDLEQVLEDEGFATTTTWDLQEALDLLAQRDFDLLLVGDHPPEVRCAEFLKALRTRQISASCIVLQTAARYPFEGQYLCWLGAYAVMPKWNYRDIVATIRECLSTADAFGKSLTRRAAAA
jgi:DNA-binding response OmpR family regulator